MKHTQKILALVIAFIMIVGTFASVSAASVSKWYDGAVECLETNGIATIGALKDKEIPREIFASWVAKIETGYTEDKTWDDASAVVDFTDVTADNKRAAIAYVYQRKFMEGNGDGTFSPERTTTFAEACMVIVRLLGFEDKLTGIESEWESNAWLVCINYCKIIDNKIKANIPVSTSGSEKKLCYGEAAYLLAQVINWASTTSSCPGTVLTADGVDLGAKFNGNTVGSRTYTAVVTEAPLVAKFTTDGANPVRSFNVQDRIARKWVYTGLLDTTKNVTLKLLTGDTTYAVGSTVTVSAKTVKSTISKALGLTDADNFREYFDKGSVVRVTLSLSSAGTVTDIKTVSNTLVDTYTVKPVYAADFAGWTTNTVTGTTGDNPILSSSFTADKAFSWTDVAYNASGAATYGKLTFKGVAYKIITGDYSDNVADGKGELKVYFGNMNNKYVANANVKLTSNSFSMYLYEIAYVKNESLNINSKSGATITAAMYNKLSAADKACYTKDFQFFSPRANVTLTVAPTAAFFLSGFDNGIGTMNNSNWMNAANKVVKSGSSVSAAQFECLADADKWKFALDGTSYKNVIEFTLSADPTTAVTSASGVAFTRGATIPAGTVLTAEQFNALARADKYSYCAVTTALNYYILATDATVAAGKTVSAQTYTTLDNSKVIATITNAAGNVINAEAYAGLDLAAKKACAVTYVTDMTPTQYVNYKAVGSYDYGTYLTAAQYAALDAETKTYFAPVYFYDSAEDKVAKVYNPGDVVPAGTIIEVAAGTSVNSLFTAAVSTTVPFYSLKSKVTFTADTVLQSAVRYGVGYETTIPVGTYLDNSEWAALTAANRAKCRPIEFFSYIVNTGNQPRRDADVISLATYTQLSAANKAKYLPCTYVVTSAIDCSTVNPAEGIIVRGAENQARSNGVGNYRTNAFQQSGVVFKAAGFQDYAYVQEVYPADYGSIIGLVMGGVVISSENYNELNSADKKGFTAVASEFNSDGSRTAGFSSTPASFAKVFKAVLNPAQGEVAMRFVDLNDDGKYDSLYILDTYAFQFSDFLNYTVDTDGHATFVCAEGNDETNNVDIYNTLGEKITSNTQLKLYKAGAFIIDQAVNNSTGGTDLWSIDTNPKATNQIQLVLFPSNDRYYVGTSWSQGYNMNFKTDSVTSDSNVAVVANLNRGYIQNVKTAAIHNGVLCYEVEIVSGETTATYYMPVDVLAETEISYTFNGYTNTMTVPTSNWLLFVKEHNRVNSIAGSKVNVGDTTGSSMAGHTIKFAAKEDGTIYCALEVYDSQVTGFVAGVEKTESGDNTYKVTIITSTGARSTYEVRASGTSIFDYANYESYQRLYIERLFSHAGTAGFSGAAEAVVTDGDFTNVTIKSDGAAYKILSGYAAKTSSFTKSVCNLILSAAKMAGANETPVYDDNYTTIQSGVSTRYNVIVASYPQYVRQGKTYTVKFEKVSVYKNVPVVESFKKTSDGEMKIVELRGSGSDHGQEKITGPQSASIYWNTSRYYVNKDGYVFVIEIPATPTYDRTKKEAPTYNYANGDLYKVYENVYYEAKDGNSYIAIDGATLTGTASPAITYASTIPANTVITAAQYAGLIAADQAGFAATKYKNAADVVLTVAPATPVAGAAAIGETIDAGSVISAADYALLDTADQAGFAASEYKNTAAVVLTGAVTSEIKISNTEFAMYYNAAVAGETLPAGTVITKAQYTSLNDTDKAMFKTLKELKELPDMFSGVLYVKGETGYIPGSYHAYVDVASFNATEKTPVTLYTPAANGDFTVKNTTMTGIAEAKIFVTNYTQLGADTIVMIGSTLEGSAVTPETDDSLMVYLVKGLSQVTLGLTSDYWIVSSDAEAVSMPNGDSVGRITVKYPTYNQAKVSQVNDVIEGNTWYKVDKNGTFIAKLGSSDTVLTAGAITSVKADGTTIATLGPKTGVDVTNSKFSFFYTDMDGYRLYKAGSSTNVTIMSWEAIQKNYEADEAIVNDATKSATERAEAAVRVKEAKEAAISSYLNGTFWSVPNSPAFKYLQIEVVTYQNPNASLTFKYILVDDTYCVFVDTFCK